MVDSSESDFEAKLLSVCKEHGAKICFDAVAGDLTNQILKCLVPGGKIYVYGVLSMRPMKIDAGEFIFKKKEVKGWWLTEHLKTKNILGLAKMSYYVKGVVGDGSLKTQI